MLRRRIKNWWNERQEVRHLKRSIEELEQRYTPLVDAAGEDEYLVIDEYIDEVSAYEPRLKFLKTTQLLRKATKLGIDVPPRTSDWFSDTDNPHGDSHYRVLTELGEAKVRNLIRKQKREDMEWWLKVIGALTGLVGVLIGLVAILK